MFGKKKHDESSEPEKRPAYTGELTAVEWKPLSKKIVEQMDSLRVLDQLPVELRQQMLDIAESDAHQASLPEDQQQAARFMCAYLRADVDEAERIAVEGIGEAFKNGVHFGSASSPAEVTMHPIDTPEGRELMRMIEESEGDDDMSREQFREIRNGPEGESFLRAWDAFSEATGVDVKLVSLNAATEGDDRFKLVIEVPERAAFMLHHGITCGTAAANDKWGLGILRPGINADHIRESGERLGAPADGLRAAVQAANLLIGKMAMKGAEFSADNKVDEESLEVAVETVDAIWKNALDEAGAPVETPHDMSKYIKWLQSEKERLQTELATLKGGGEETS